ncbi:MAG: hypothetical protein IKL32_01680 [Alphaproteobacteria bacterium]|nr:hypothetical protein [Alphaproteobacteria bacterium]
MATKNLQYESGRSMVEMLGTLAIIGVLSIGGIAGYSYGMDKHKANQTINDIMLMGVDMITQTSQKRGVLTLAEWGTKTTAGYNFTVTSNPDNNTQYGIQITGVPSRVCQMVGDGLKTTAEVYVDNADYATAEDPCNSSEENTMSFFFEPVETAFGECKTDTDCGDGRYCDADTGICFRGTAPEGTYGDCTTTNECCEKGDNPYYKHGSDCSTDTIANGMCYYGTCVAKGCTYNENKCTGKAEYCASPSTNCEEAFPNGKTGTCVKADFAKLDVGGKTYYVSHNTMSWWDADAACKALGRDGLVSVNDLVTGWTSKYDHNSDGFTALGAALQSHLGTGSQVWTSDDYDSCDAFFVNLDDGDVYDCGRYDSYSFAVCQ